MWRGQSAVVVGVAVGIATAIAPWSPTNPMPLWLLAYTIGAYIAIGAIWAFVATFHAQAKASIASYNEAVWRDMRKNLGFREWVKTSTLITTHQAALLSGGWNEQFLRLPAEKLRELEVAYSNAAIDWEYNYQHRL